MNPYQISQDPIWHRWVDGLVILLIGFVAGLLLAGGILLQEVTTVEVIKSTPILQSPSNSSSQVLGVPDITFEDI